MKKDDDGHAFVRCRLVAREFKPKREGPRDFLFAAMPPLEAKRALFAYVSGVREKGREQGQDEVKLTFIDVKKAHFHVKCEGEGWVKLPKEFNTYGKYVQLKICSCHMTEGASGREDDYTRRLVSDWFERGVGMRLLATTERAAAWLAFEASSRLGGEAKVHRREQDVMRHSQRRPHQRKDIVTEEYGRR